MLLGHSPNHVMPALAQCFCLPDMCVQAELQTAPLGYSEHAPLVLCHKLFSSLTISLVLRKSSKEPDIPSLPLLTKPVLMGAQPSATMRHRRLLPSELTNENINAYGLPHDVLKNACIVKWLFQAKLTYVLSYTVVISR